LIKKNNFRICIFQTDGKNVLINYDSMSFFYVQIEKESVTDANQLSLTMNLAHLLLLLL